MAEHDTFVATVKVMYGENMGKLKKSGSLCVLLQKLPLYGNYWVTKQKPPKVLI